MDYSEKLVVNGLKAGDTEAYQYIFDTHYQVLCYTANRYVRDSFVAETIVGDMIDISYVGKPSYAQCQHFVAQLPHSGSAQRMY